MADAVPVLRAGEQWAELGCLPCLRRFSVREGLGACAGLRLYYGLQCLARAALLPWFSPSALLREVLARGGLRLEEFQAQQRGQLYVQMYGDETERTRTSAALLGVLREVAKADGELDAAEVQRIRSLLAMLHDGEPELWQQIDGEEPMPLDAALAQLRTSIRVPDHTLILSLMLSVAQRSNETSLIELQRIGELGLALNMDGDLLDEVLGPWRAQRVADAPAQSSDWQVLELERGASQGDIRKAYLRLAMNNHPDRFAHLGPAATKQANERMKAINAAYRALRNKSN